MFICILQHHVSAHRARIYLLYMYNNDKSLRALNYFDVAAIRYIRYGVTPSMAARPPNHQSTKSFLSTLKHLWQAAPPPRRRMNEMRVCAYFSKLLTTHTPSTNAQSRASSSAYSYTKIHHRIRWTWNIYKENARVYICVICDANLIIFFIALLIS